VLERRCSWRGIDVAVSAAGIGTRIDPEGHDLFYIGGGQDADQRRCAHDLLATKAGALAEAVEGGAVVLGICGGYQLLGHSYEIGEDVLPGIGLVDVQTRREPGPRLVANVVMEVDGLGLPGGPRLLAGFENHAGRTYLGPSARPLGRVRPGQGNNGIDGTEGVRNGRVVGTYLHGPLLPKNAWFADWLIASALDLPPLDGLNDHLEDAVHAQACELGRVPAVPPR
jgi:hypothetical protein